MNIIEELQEKQRLRYWKYIRTLIFIGLIVIPVEFIFHGEPIIKGIYIVIFVISAIYSWITPDDPTFKGICPRCQNNLLQGSRGNVSLLTERFCPYCQLDLLNFPATGEEVKSPTQTLPPADFSVVSRKIESDTAVPSSDPYSPGVKTPPMNNQVMKQKMPLRLFVRLRLLAILFAISGIFIAFPLMEKVSEIWLKFIFFAPIVLGILAVCGVAYFMRCPSCKKDLFNVGDAKNCPRCGVEFIL